MTAHRILRAYTTQYTDPITLKTGDIVTLGEEEQEEKWKGWIWAEGNQQKGWIPLQILETSEDKKTGKVIEDYTAKELTIEKDEEILKIKSLNGWTWAKNIRTQEEGWIPDEVIE